MGLNFEFATASRIVFGNDSSRKLPDLIEKLGRRVLIVTGKNQSNADWLKNEIQSRNIVCKIFSIHSEPTATDITAGINIGRDFNCDVVVGIGGGSAVDSAKAIAAIIPNSGDLTDYLEVIGKGRKLEKVPLSCIAVPTTAGTGAEVTKNSVIKSIANNVKVSLRSDLMYPTYAVVDPVLTLSMPPAITASTGVDALTHLMETFVSNQANPFIGMFCREGMKRISGFLEQAYSNGKNLEARENMSIASMLGGIALANVKLGAVHGFAGPMGGMFPIPHGEVCACLLPAVMEVNIEATKESNEELYIRKYDEVAKILTNDKNAEALDGIEWVTKLVSRLKIPSLGSFGINENDFPELIEKAQNSSSMKGNPVLLNRNQLYSILEKSM